VNVAVAGDVTGASITLAAGNKVGADKTITAQNFTNEDKAPIDDQSDQLSSEQTALESMSAQLIMDSLS
jgi:hypothetical protein